MQLLLSCKNCVSAYSFSSNFFFKCIKLQLIYQLKILKNSMDFEMRILPILIKVLPELSLGEWQRMSVCLFVSHINCH